MNTGSEWPEVQGVKGTIRRCKAENVGLTEYQLRKAICSGSLRVRRPSGSRNVLIAWPTLLSWLRCDEGQDNTPPTATDGIRPIN